MEIIGNYRGGVSFKSIILVGSSFFTFISKKTILTSSPFSFLFYRCNVSAVDLNRQWIDPSKKAHPTIFHTKHLIRKTKEERDILLYCDIHGHSRKKNIFVCKQNVLIKVSNLLSLFF